MQTSNQKTKNKTKHAAIRQISSEITVEMGIIYARFPHQIEEEEEKEEEGDEGKVVQLNRASIGKYWENLRSEFRLTTEFGLTRGAQKIVGKTDQANSIIRWRNVVQR